MNLVLPIAGKSSRFDTSRPKWLLTHPNGNLMLTEAIKGLNPSQFEKIIIIALKEHEEQFKFIVELKKELRDIYKTKKIFVVLIDGSRNQPETIYKGLKQINLSGGILIKDCDNYFEIPEIKSEFNTVFVGDLNNNQKIIAGNKSYVSLGASGTIVNIIEKQVVGNLFCCGGYYFKDVNRFYETFEMLQTIPTLFLSHIIYKMILEKELFITESVTNYIDWGTQEDWNLFTAQYKVLFVDIDGVLVKNSSKRFQPQWGTTEGLIKNIEFINKLYDTGKCQIILTTSRSEKAKKITISQLKKNGLKYHKLIMGLFHGKRYLINDYAISNNYPTAVALNLQRDNDTLQQFFKGETR